MKRLLASPGDRAVTAYPPSLVRRADARLALDRRGHLPVIVLFFDDSSRASDLQAAEFLPVLTKYADHLDIVAIDVSQPTTWSDDERKIVHRFYMAVVPTTVVLDAERRPLLLEYRRIAGARLEAVIEDAVK